MKPAPPVTRTEVGVCWGIRIEDGAQEETRGGPGAEVPRMPSTNALHGSARAAGSHSAQEGLWQGLPRRANGLHCFRRFEGGDVAEVAAEVGGPDHPPHHLRVARLLEGVHEVDGLRRERLTVRRHEPTDQLGAYRFRSLGARL